MAINVWTFLFQVINFVILVSVLRWLLYRPLVAAIDQRREANAKAQADADQARREADALREQLNQQLASLDQQRQERIRQARERAEAEQKTLRAEAERDIQRRREEVDQQIERERVEALETLRGELVKSAVALAERLLREAAGATLQGQLAARLIEELQRIPDDERRRLREEWTPDDHAIIESAVELNGETLQCINGALASLAGRAVAVDMQTKPALLAGLRLRLGGHVWDASVSGALGGDGLAALAPGNTSS